MLNHTGGRGEDIAAEFLELHDFRIIERNYRMPVGEIDLVAEKYGVLHFVEVKTSKFHPNPAFSPEIRIDARKISAMKRICEVYLRERKINMNKNWQIDVVSVIIDDEGTQKSLEFFENAIFEKPY